MKILRLLALMFLLVSPTVWAADEDPLQLVKETADRVLHEVTVHKDSLKIDSSGIYVIVKQHILPHFDFSTMTRSAVGKYWPRATEDQQKQLENEFTQLLVRTYGVALLNYSGQEIIYKPLREDADADRVMIETFVAENNGGPQIPVNYRLIKRDGVWKVYDVVIDGVSLVSNYRTSFAGQIRRSGIDGLISELSQRNKG
jgi:phospholipid transport system substrate-binding protein